MRRAVRVLAVGLCAWLPVSAWCQAPNGFIQSDSWASLVPIQGLDCTGGGPKHRLGDWLAPRDLSLENPVVGTVWSDIDFGGDALSDAWLGDGRPTFVSIGNGVAPDVVDYEEYLNDKRFENDWVAAVAVTYVENTTGSPLEVGVCTASDDSIVVWLNQEVVANVTACRGVAGDCSETAPGVLAPGVNRITVLLFEGHGGMGFRLALLRPNGDKFSDADSEIVFLGATDNAAVVGPLPRVSRTYPGSAFDVPAPSHVVRLQGEGFVPGVTYTVVEEIEDVRLSEDDLSNITAGGVVEPILAPAQGLPTAVGDFDDHHVVGGAPCGPSSQTTFDGTSYISVAETGGDIWENGDTFEFAYSRIEGDFDISIAFRQRDHSSGVGRWGKFGPMARRSLSNTSRYSTMQDHLPDLQDAARFAGRTVHDQAPPTGNMFETVAVGVSPHPLCLRLTRRGNVFEGWASDEALLVDGALDPRADAHWVLVGVDDWGIDAPETAFVGFSNSENVNDGCAIQTVGFELLAFEGKRVGLEGGNPIGLRIRWEVDGDELNNGNVGYEIRADRGTLLPVKGRAASSWTRGPDHFQFQNLGFDSLGIFDGSTDIGEGGPCTPGLTTYNPARESYTIEASGLDIWQGGDQFHYAYREVEGDFDMRARFFDLQSATTGARWGKHGLMARWDATPLADYFFVHRAGASDIDCQIDGPRTAHRFNAQAGDVTQEPYTYFWQDVYGDELTDSLCVYPNPDVRGNDVRGDDRNNPPWLRMVRRGNTFYGYGSDDGEDWRTLGVYTRPVVPERILLGVANTSHADCGVQIVSFDSVEIEAPTPIETQSDPLADADSLGGTVVARADFDGDDGDCPTGWDCNHATGAGPAVDRFKSQLFENRLVMATTNNGPLGVGDSTATTAFLKEPIDSDGAYVFDFDLRFEFDPNVDGAALPGDGLTFALLGVEEVERRDVIEEPRPIDETFTQVTIGLPCAGDNNTFANGDDSYTTRATTGHDTWVNGDVFEYAYTYVEGDFDMSIELLEKRFPPTGRWGKFGLMARKSLDMNSKHTSMIDHGPDLQDPARIARRGDHLRGGSMQEPATTGGFVTDPNDGSSLLHPRFLRLTRRGDFVDAWASNTADMDPTDDGNWHLLFSDSWEGELDGAYLGFAYSTHNSGGCESGEIEWAVLHLEGTPATPPARPANPYSVDVRVGDDGGGLGYGRINSSRAEYGVPSKELARNSFAVEFDNWHGGEIQNEGDGHPSGFDPTGGALGTGSGQYHIGLNVNGSLWSVQRNIEVGVHDHQLPDIYQPRGIHARVLYDHGRVRAWVRSNGAATDWSLVVDSDIEPLSLNSSKALVGFTASTGGARTIMTVDNFEMRTLGDVGTGFVRADPDSGGSIALTDGIVVLNALFRGGEIACDDAADSDDSGTINLTDGVFIFRWLFGGGASPPPPTPSTPSYPSSDCGQDPTEDGLGCETGAPVCS